MIAVVICWFFLDIKLSSFQPSRTFFPQEIPVMLHRSPSGAKRKIRQRREEGSRPSPFLAASSASTSPTPSSTPNESNYRSLIDSGAYQSILPDFDSSFIPLLLCLFGPRSAARRGCVFPVYLESIEGSVHIQANQPFHLYWIV
ncbi:unnamed protein product [Heligmosomoides polygyrus]|uniref:Peptidase A2 domain-containing protein n=1 Tax=Heligmosomoides polygyrus TaxID=6339 RepID=A0A183G0K1_HELPZ|nr:unnamed protein product [Heligmosomoides polygyrus]